ncbi:MAG: cytochrome d ubiquinol oxidase subunit II [Phycisphaerales bacterium]|nr:MAG: cytochrome d ubiquinol oxidase subunit II [Phycisphaerales bacterium]
MDLNTTWFLLIWVLLTGYAILDGFDLGVGVLHLFARDERERRIHTGAIGPFWDGNEVWLLTGAGALFAAFPVVYATVFSSFYLALMLLLFALICRAVSLEFRSQVDSPGWRRAWDWAFGLGSLIPAILFGVAIGNILRGIPIEADGRANVSFASLLNPYALLIGVLSLAMFTMHGAAFLAIKSEGDLQRRAARWVFGAWVVFVILYLSTFAATFYAAPFLFEGAFSRALFWVFLVILLLAAVYTFVANRAGKYLRSFLASSVSIASVMGLTAVCLFPRVVPSSLDLAHSLTVYNASSTPRTLTVMLIIALVGMPIVIAYSAYIYRVFAGKVVISQESY